MEKTTEKGKLYYPWFQRNLNLTYEQCYDYLSTLLANYWSLYEKQNGLIWTTIRSLWWRALGIMEVKHWLQRSVGEGGRGRPCAMAGCCHNSALGQTVDNLHKSYGHVTNKYTEGTLLICARRTTLTKQVLFKLYREQNYCGSCCYLWFIGFNCDYFLCVFFINILI